MDETEMVQSVQAAVIKLGADDKIRARRSLRAARSQRIMFAGGVIGGDIGDDVGAGGIGIVGVALAAQHIHDAASGLPESMLVGVSDRTIYGFEKHRGHHEAGRLVFRVDRAELDVKVHQRINVRVLELIPFGDRFARRAGRPAFSGPARDRRDPRARILSVPTLLAANVPSPDLGSLVLILLASALGALPSRANRRVLLPTMILEIVLGR